MKIELHLHTNRYSACCVDEPETLMAELIRAGYGAVYITEHDAVWPADDIAELQARFAGIRIYGGVELTLGVPQSMHLLVLGTSDPEYVSLRYDPCGVIQKAQAHGHLTVLAHPFRWRGGDQILDEFMLPDAIEFRSSNHDRRSARRSREAAERLNLPIVNGGDVHSVDMIDRFWIDTHEPLERAGDIREIVLNGRYDLGMWDF